MASNDSYRRSLATRPGGEMRAGWDEAAPAWIEWARAPGHDSYWRYHRELFLPIVPARSISAVARDGWHATSMRSATTSSPSTGRRA